MSCRPLPERADVVVIGARAAGAATAMLLARAGLDVLAIDRGAPGSDTLSTHALMRAGTLQLARWGLLDRIVAAGTPIVRRTTFVYGDRRLPVEIRPRDGVDGLVAPRRALLDSTLVDAARAAGAKIVFGRRLTGLLRTPDGRVTGVECDDGCGPTRRVAARWVVGADGLRSTVARALGLVPRKIARHASAVVYGYWKGLGLDGYEWRYVPGASVGAIPTNDDATCIFVALPAAQFARELAPDPEAGFLRLLERVAPDLAAAVARAERSESLRGFPGEPGFLRPAWGPGWALVGDAGYFKDPITAHGLSDALRDSELLARALVDGTDRALAGYESERDRLSADLFEVTDAIAAYDWNLDEVAALHRRLAEAMKAEVETLAALGPFASRPYDRRTA